MDHDELRGLLAARPVSAVGSVNNPLGLAIELLRSDAIAAALQGLDRASLSVLLEAGDGRELADPQLLGALRDVGLLGFDPTALQPVPLPEITSALRGYEAAELLELGLGRPADSSDATPDTSAWFGPALASTVRAAALLRSLPGRPARLSRKGAVTVIALRDLALVTHDAPEATGRLMRVLQFAGLAKPFTAPGRNSVLLPAPDAADWLSQSQPARWLRLAQALVARSNAHLRRAIELSGGDLRTAVDSRISEEFPLLPAAALAHASEWADLAEQLGLSVGGQLTPSALELLSAVAASSPVQDATWGSATAEAVALADAERDFPQTASGVYLQPDLSVIVPGPLNPSDERVLGEIADTEQLGVASTLRISLASLQRARRSGLAVEQIRALLERLSLTGIPQPLDFMLGDLERQPEPLRQDDPRATAWLKSHGITPRAGIAASSGLTPTPAAAAMPFPRDADQFTAYESEASAGALRAAARETLLDEAAKRIYAAARANSGVGDLTHRLELAIRDRKPVRVTAAGPEERTFVLLPVALAGGRLRATDQAAGVERTLPISAITAVDAT